MDDRWQLYPNGLESPPSDGFAVTPSDTEDLQEPVRGFYIGTGGDLRVTMRSGAVLDFKNVPGGTDRIMQAQRVWATGTTAADIVGLL